MGWAAIVAALIELFGPLLQDWLKDCTAERLSDAARELPEPDTFGSEGEAASALFDRAISDLPRLAFVRRAALRRAKAAAVVGKKIRRTPLTAAELAEGRDYVGGVKGE
jgi:hypothetical protein